LGALEVLRDGGPLVISGKRPKKPLELLALLAAQGRKPLPLEAAVETLWASPDGEDRKGSLEVALSRLRKLLGVPGAVMLADGGLRLDLRVVWTDIAEFEALEKRILSGDDRAQAIESGAQLLLLFRGVLLSGEALSGPWRALREQFSRRFLHLVLRHGAALEAQGQWGDAADAYRHGIECDVLAEPLYRALMRAQLQLGERAEALRTFPRCREVLSSMLGVAPAQETLALREQTANLNR
jgi:DNA-binding SARP family transcriptional activator